MTFNDDDNIWDMTVWEKEFCVTNSTTALH